MIIKIRDRYFEWSTVADAPVTHAMTGEQLREYIQHEYGAQGLRELGERMKRVEASGCSGIGTTLEDLMCCNRAGAKEAHITEDQIYSRYANPLTP